MSDELIEAVADQMRRFQANNRTWHMQDLARAAYAVLAPVLLEKGVRLGLEAAAKEVHSFKDKRREDGTDDWFAFVDISMCVRQLDAAAIARSEP